MSQAPAPERMAQAAKRSPTAVLTTLGRNGPRSRLVHPLWNADGASGYLLTDGQSPKVADLTRCGRVSLTYHHPDTWFLIAAESAINDDTTKVEQAVADCSEREDGYLPADFWNDQELRRLIVVEL